MSDALRTPYSPLPRFRGTQVGLRDPALVDRIKEDMLNGSYAFDEPRGQLGGVIDESGTYCVYEGHHRLVAALELLRETGDDSFIRLLMRWGAWDRVVKPPPESRPMPSRYFWGKLRNRLGY